jgi:hypothetical protein
MKKNKRAEITKDCERFWILHILEAYKHNLWSNKNPKLHHLAWVVYSDYLLLSKSKNWYCVCVTCGTIDQRHSSAMHPWHFRTAGSSLKHKYNNDNVRPQCVWCNVMKNGNYQKYTLFMIDKFGREWVDDILQDKWTINIKWFQYAEMIQKRYDFIQHNANYESDNNK